jgi:arginine/lysine/histidine transporter system substrate-binding protein
MKKIKYILILPLIFLMCGCGKNDNELVMVTEAGFAPYEYYENNEITGVDIAVAKDIADAMGKKLVVKDVAFDSIINEINSGKADFGAAGMSITEERKKSVDFTIEYAKSSQVVISRSSDTIDINDLSNKIIDVQLGSVADNFVTEKYPNNKIIRQKKYLSAAEDVKNNKADIIIMDSLPAKKLVEENSGLRIQDGVLFTDSYGMVVKKGNTDLLNKMNEVLKRDVEEGKIDKYTIEYTK